MSDLLTTPEVAALAGCSVRTVHRAIDDLELTPVMRAGKNENSPYLFKPSEAARWIQERSSTDRGESADSGRVVGLPSGEADYSPP